ncbi:hypothetical protein LL999_23065 [Burkholderia ambifaria]|uniref:hypothetical protein n=1 Tax=Burkholderia ambifaria TaxID=152480 RepID=UPI001E453B25|nr:hypothetical protein [Burkholderia ambifaria]UEP23129.1 hypothetical protein LL999_23065 [Burkholderia ambifaria]
MKRPSFQFYPGDWLNDAALRMVSVGARGLWIDMMCIMHQGSEYGYLKVNGKVILPPNLARMTGSTLEETEGFLGELESSGVFSKDESGCIFSRRMIRDEKVREARAAGGVKGGNPALMGKKKVNHQDNLEPTPSSPSSPSMSSPSEKKARAPRFDARGFLLNHGATEKTVDAWLEIRKGKRLKQTDIAMEGAVDEAKKAGMTLEAALTLCCKRGWGGFDAAWVGGRSPPTNFQDRNDATIAALTGRDRSYEPDDRTIDV